VFITDYTIGPQNYWINLGELVKFVWLTSNEPLEEDDFTNWIPGEEEKIVSAVVLTKFGSEWR